MSAARTAPSADWRQLGQDYQIVARATDTAIQFALRAIHAKEFVRTGRTDAGPIVAGAVGAIVSFVGETDMPLAKLREKLLEVFDAVAPQVEIERAARRMGAAPNGAGTQ